MILGVSVRKFGGKYRKDCRHSPQKVSLRLGVLDCAFRARPFRHAFVEGGFQRDCTGGYFKPYIAHYSRFHFPLPQNNPNITTT